MHVVLYTSDSAIDGELFRYLYAHLVDEFASVTVVSTRPAAPARRPAARAKHMLRRIRRRAQLIGIRELAGALASYPLQRRLQQRAEEQVLRELARLPRPGHRPRPSEVTYVESANGRQAQETLQRLAPDILVQAGAGILRSTVYTIPTLATLNLHHGIAPRIRGMASIQWALFHERPEWIGATVHRIDAGIDTGEVLAWAPISERTPGEGFPSLFARATEAGVLALLDVMHRLEARERWSLPVDGIESQYRSSIPGWRLWIAELRRKRRARRGEWLGR